MTTFNNTDTSNTDTNNTDNETISIECSSWSLLEIALVSIATGIGAALLIGAGYKYLSGDVPLDTDMVKETAEAILSNTDTIASDVIETATDTIT